MGECISVSLSPHPFLKEGCSLIWQRGSSLLRRVLYLAALRNLHLQNSAFGVYYHRLVARGLKKGSVLMAFMRKMLVVAAHLLLHEGDVLAKHFRAAL